MLKIIKLINWELSKTLATYIKEWNEVIIFFLAKLVIGKSELKLNNDINIHNENRSIVGITIFLSIFENFIDCE